MSIKGYNLTSTSPLKVKVSIVYVTLDQLQSLPFCPTPTAGHSATQDGTQDVAVWKSCRRVEDSREEGALC